MQLEPLIETATMTTGVWRRLGVHLFEGKLSLDDMSLIEAAGDRWHASHPGHVVELTIIFPSPARMSGDERARMTAIIKRWQPMRTASATVILAEGMTGALQRSVLTGMMLLAPAPHPAKVFGAISPAVDWLTPFLAGLAGPEATRSAFIHAVETLSADFRNKRAAAVSG